jgi:serine protease Do
MLSADIRSRASHFQETAMSVHNRRLSWAAAGIFAVGAVSGWSAPQLLHVAPATEPASSVAASAAAPAPIGPIGPMTTPNYRAIVAQNQAAVVGVSIEGRMNVSSPQMPDLGQLFGFDPRGNRGHDRAPDRMPMHGQGSGFIVSADGLVLTNAHVVKDADQVTVKLTDHREYKAKVLAIGAPFGLEQTATAGIVSAKGRSLPGDGAVPYIQTDAAVNPGNSGGPLFDASGAVVGINSQIYTNSGGYQGVAFAIPINLAMDVEGQIVKTGKVEHGRLGVEVQTLDQSLADSFHLKSPAGALVAKVMPDSAGARAGLRPGDVILKFNGDSIDSAGQLSARVNATTPGGHATLEIWRDGKSMTLTATVGSAREQTAESHGAPEASDATQLGLTVRPLTADERQEVGVQSGLVVEDAQGRAAQAGIQQGDVVLAVDGTPVHSAAELRELVHQHDKQIALLIQRGESRIFVPVALG